MGGKREPAEETCDLATADVTSDATIDTKWLGAAVIVSEERPHHNHHHSGKQHHRVTCDGDYVPVESDFVIVSCENDCKLFLHRSSTYKVYDITIKNISLSGSVKLCCHEEDEFIGCLNTKDYMISQIGYVRLVLTNNQWVPC